MLRIPTRPPTSADHGAPKDGATLLAQQNLCAGTIAALLAAAAATALWVWSGMLFDRYFPWASMLEGVMVGIAMRRRGRGVDWRFPAAAAAITAIAAPVGSFLNALFLTGREFGTGAWALVDEISLYTIERFLTREFGTVGLIYMLFAAPIAAFYANRRLKRGEAAALRRARNS